MFRPVAPNMPLAALFRGSLHMESSLEAVAQYLHFCDSVVKKKLGLFRFVLCYWKVIEGDSHIL